MLVGRGSLTGGVVGISLWLVGCQNDVVYLDKSLIAPDVRATTVGITSNTPTHSAIVIRAVNASTNSKTSARIQTVFQAPLCQATVLQPALFKSQNKKVLVREGAKSYTQKTAVTATNAIKIQIMPAHFAHETVPAVYKTVIEKIPVKRERYELVVEPAQYRTAHYPQEVKPAYLRWREGCFTPTDQAKPISEADNSPCVMSQEAQVLTIKQQLVDLLPRFSWRLIPAEFEEVERKILVKAGKGSGLVPAQYRTVELHHVAEKWAVEGNEASAASEYQTVPIEVLERPARLRRQVSLCEAQMTSRDIERLQRQLAQVSGQAVVVNGKMDATTKNAILHYQQQQGLAQGAVTLETLQALGF
ncbi:peptidoglycan-binding protein [Thiofilum flexile]|uniref:peptidoglycan-binding protein n=1 Tax=Thiofilum flexile TaxID=125627 RepID=UPI00037BCF82|nr:peptidoglycan-binding protein [Thiofilum flexile]